MVLSTVRMIGLIWHDLEVRASGREKYKIARAMRVVLRDWIIDVAFND